MFITNILGGRLIVDPELRFLDSGSAVCSLRVSVRVSRKQKDGEQYAPSEIVELSFWGKEFAQRVADSFSKGDQISCTGRVTSIQCYPRKDGSSGATISIVVDQLAWPARPATNGAGPSRVPEEPDFVSASDIAF